MVEEGVASAEDIDKAMELGYRHPMGPLKLTDLVGLDVRLGIAEYLAERARRPRVSSRPRSCAAWCARASSARRAGRASTTGPPAETPADRRTERPLLRVASVLRPTTSSAVSIMRSGPALVSRAAPSTTSTRKALSQGSTKSGWTSATPVRIGREQDVQALRQPAALHLVEHTTSCSVRRCMCAMRIFASSRLACGLGR